jgi:S1-C subfamily serine protease
MLVDIAIIIFAISALLRGRDSGLLRQLFSTVGFFGGLFIGAALEPHTVTLAHSTLSRSIITLITTLGCALVFLTVGEYIGISLKHKVLLKRVNEYDNLFGAGVGLVTFLISIWLSAAILASLPFAGVQTELKSSHIIGALNNHLPSAPTVIADFGQLIDPNGFPQVFIGQEPNPGKGVNLPDLGQLQTAVTADKASVVKVAGQGCGGIVEGSGFVVGDGLIATNAHVVAGIKHPYVQDSNGTHSATVIWFDPNLDFAVLRVPNLAGSVLKLSVAHQNPGTPAAVLGYPGGGPFTAGPAALIEEFTATGRNIYGKGNTNRDVYEIQATVIPGNSGGPLVTQDGSVIGVVFAESTAYNHVGYALTTKQISQELASAKTADKPASTGSCAE